MRGAAAIAGGTAKAAVRALAAGADLLCIGAQVDAALVEETIAEIADAVRDGVVSAARLEEAVERVDGLAAWTVAAAAPGGAGDAGDALGYPAAQRAIKIEGGLPGLAAPLVVQVEESEVNIAVGRGVPWGL